MVTGFRSGAAVSSRVTVVKDTELSLEVLISFKQKLTLVLFVSSF